MCKEELYIDECLNWFIAKKNICEAINLSKKYRNVPLWVTGFCIVGQSAIRFIDRKLYALKGVIQN